MNYKEKAISLINVRLDTAESELKSLIALLVEVSNRPERQICLSELERLANKYIGI